MKKTGVFYGSSTGTCEELANQIAEKLGVSSTDVHLSLIHISEPTRH